MGPPGMKGFAMHIHQYHAAHLHPTHRHVQLDKQSSNKILLAKILLLGGLAAAMAVAVYLLSVLG